MTAAPMVRVLIVDDEPLAREGLRLLLARDDEIEIVGEAASGNEAVTSIRALHPDLVFLDIQMPGKSGFEALAELDVDELPAIVFVTAYDEYAVRAFAVHALDYLLKPYDDERFAQALARAKQQVRLEQLSDLSERLMSLAQAVDPDRKQTRTDGPLTRLAVRSAGRVVFLNVGEIDWIEAADYYVQLHVGDDVHLHRQSLSSLEHQLDDRFIRVHRSAIVNRDRIRELRHHGRRELVVVLDSGEEIKVARSHRDKLSTLA